MSRTCIFLLMLAGLVFWPLQKLTANEAVFSPILEDETILAVHVDLKGIDIPKIIETNKPLFENVINALELRSEEFQRSFIPNEAERKHFAALLNDLDNVAQIVQGGKVFLESVLGIEEAYLLLNLKGPEIVDIIIPKNDKLNVPMLKTLVPENSGLVINETDKFLFLSLNVTGENTAENRPINSRPRPEFIAAWNAVKDYPIKIMVAPPTYFKKVLKEAPPKFPQPFEKIDLEKLIGGLKWKAAGFDPAKPEFYAIAETESELAAKEIQAQSHLLFNTVADYVIELTSELESGAFGEMEKELIRTLSTFLSLENRKMIFDAIVPEPQGNRFVIKAGAEEINSFTENTMPLIVKFFQAPIMAAQEAARRMQCTNNLKQIILAFHNYYDINGSIPPAYTVDDNGKPLHSWRVLILPYIEQKALYDAIKLDEPWDSEHNKQFHEMMPITYRCPSFTNGNEKRDTTYCMVVGDDTVGNTDGTGINFRQITDGTSNTIGVVERKTSVCWMAPLDIKQEDAYLGVNKTDTGVGSPHSGGVNVALCDGSVRFVSETVDLELWKALLTIAGGESKSF